MGLYLDLAKVFVTHNYGRLAEKMKTVFVAWFETYPANRKHRVNIGDILSSEMEMDLDVRQGSVFRPIQ